MKAAVTTGEKGKIIAKDVPKPRVQPGTLLLKTRCCSICGSDLEYLDGNFEYMHGEGGKLRAGSIPGHEFCAEVAEVGEGVEGWSVGDRVTRGGIRGSCGECWYCHRRLPFLCLGVAGIRSLTAIDVEPKGFGGQAGAMAEYFLFPAKGLQKVPDNVSDEEAALVEPFRTSLGAVTVAEIGPGDSVVIIGAGKIGLGALLGAKLAGAAPIIVIDLVKSRLDKALELGADAVMNAKEVDIVSEVVRLTEAGSDAVLICVRDGKVLNHAIDMARRGGTIVLAGFVLPTEITPGILLWKNLKLIGENGTSPLSLSMRLIANKQVNVEPLISAIMPLDDVQKGFDSMYSGENVVVLVRP